jgi:hypothetical protein
MDKDGDIFYSCYTDLSDSSTDNIETHTMTYIETIKKSGCCFPVTSFIKRIKKMIKRNNGSDEFNYALFGVS